MVPRNGSTASIFFVNSQNILYEGKSYDLIFPATEPYDLGKGIGVNYRRPYRQATILGCVDRNRWRVPSISSEWYDLDGADWKGDYFNPDWFQKAHPRAPGLVRLTLKALQDSCMAMSIQRRGGLGLAASNLLENGHSRPLPEGQWKVEAKRFFDTSLTRIQINLRDVALGAQAKYGANKSSSNNAELCQGTFIFTSQGWQNVQVSGSAWILVVSLLVLLLAIPLDDDRLLVELLLPPARCTAQYTTLVLIWLYDKIRIVAGVVKRSLFVAALHLYAKVSGFWAGFGRNLFFGSLQEIQPARS